jgi:hypothetical protein
MTVSKSVGDKQSLTFTYTAPLYADTQNYHEIKLQKYTVMIDLSLPGNLTQIDVELQKNIEGTNFSGVEIVTWYPKFVITKT